MWSARATALAIGLCTLWAFYLSPLGFFSGDSGAKLIQTIDLWNQRFSTRALAYDPRLTDSAHRRMGDLFEIDDGSRRIGIYSVVFIAAAAPFVAALGMRGTNVLPLVGLVLTLLALRRLLHRLGVTDKLAALAVLFVGLATPVFAYSGQFFEHTLACGLVTTAVALLSSETPAGKRALAGGLTAIAATLRPEAYCAVTAMAFALVLDAPTRRLKRVAPFALAALVVLIAYWIVNVATTSVWDPLVVSHRGTIPRPRDALTMLWGDIPVGHPWLWLGVTAVLWVGSLGGRLVVRILAGVGTSALAVAAAAISSARILSGLLTVTPVLFLGLAVVPETQSRRFAWVVAVTFIVQVLLLAHGTMGGGLQLGSRILLPAIPMLVALAAAVIELPTDKRIQPVLAAALALLSVIACVRGTAQAVAIAQGGASAVQLAEKVPGRLVIGRRHWEAGILAPLLLKGRDVVLSYPDDEGSLFDRLARLGEHRCVVVDREAVWRTTPDNRRVRTIGSVQAWPGWITLQLVEIL